MLTAERPTRPFHDNGQQEKVVGRFSAERDEQYREFLGRCSEFEKEIAKEFSINKFTYAELEEEDTDLKKLQGWLEKIKKLDFYGAPVPVGNQVLAKIKSTSAMRLSKYSKSITATFASHGSRIWMLVPRELPSPKSPNKTRAC
ncbi:Chromate resistance protein ChrB [Bradyrhizobium erythrophlei]|uniref:Chromate resistance protein ChrB n=1 Tax=Bradyrhizobium erythrophlei TaxID=1437360 RepID=UPI0035EE83B2